MFIIVEFKHSVFYCIYKNNYIFKLIRFTNNILISSQFKNVTNESGNEKI